MIGKVVDGSALAAMARGDTGAVSWVMTAHATSSPLYAPERALAEVRASRPHAEEDLRVLRDHPAVVVKEMTLSGSPRASLRRRG